MITATKLNGTVVRRPTLVNRGQWFGKCWLVCIQNGYTCAYFVVEADSESDVVDELADSKHYDWIQAEQCDACKQHNYDACECSRAGNNGKPVDLTQVISIARCSVNYFAKP